MATAKSTPTTKSTTTPTPPPTPFLPFTDLLKASWETFKNRLLAIFGLGIVNVVIVWLLTFVIVAIAVGSIGLKVGYSDLSSPQALVTTALAQLPLLIVLGLLYFVVISVISFVIQAALIKVIAGSDDQASVSEAITSSFHLILPLFVIGMITSFLVAGGFMLFLIPGMVIALLLGWSSFELILEGTGVVDSLRNSVRIVSQNFGAIFIRIVGFYFIVLVLMGVVGLFGSLITHAETSAGIIYGLLRMVVNTLFGWFSLVFVVKLYQEARSRTNFKQGGSLAWMIVVAVIGWLLIGLIAAAVINLVRSGSFQDIFEQAKQAEMSSTTVGNAVPSECGLSFSVPDTTDTLDDVERKWVYEEISQIPDSFHVLDQDVHPRDAVVLAALAYKAADDRIDEAGKSIAYPGLNIYCTANPKHLTLEEYTALAVASKDNQVAKVDNGNFGAVPTTHVTVAGTNQAGDFTDNVFLAVSQDGNRLMFIRIWSADADDPQAEQIAADLDTIIRHLDYRAVGPTLLVPDPIAQPAAANSQPAAPASPSCTRMNIREGEFASNKCYSQSDYNDLAYYLQRFNSAAFSYNGAISGMNITCSGSEFFKDNCERHKAQKAKAEEDMSGYRTAINAIIARGTE